LDVLGGNFYVCKDAAQGAAVWLATVQSPVTPGGSDTHIQYNSSGSFAGSSKLTWSSNTLTVTGKIMADALGDDGLPACKGSQIGGFGGGAIAWDATYGNMYLRSSNMAIGDNGGNGTDWFWRSGNNYLNKNGLVLNSGLNAVPLSITGANGQTADLVNVTSYGGTAGDRLSIAAGGVVTINSTTDKTLNLASGLYGPQLSFGSAAAIRSNTSNQLFFYLPSSGMWLDNVLNVTSTTSPQVTVRYDANNYASFTVSSSGDLTITPSGFDVGVSAYSNAAPVTLSVKNTYLGKQAILAAYNEDSSASCSIAQFGSSFTDYAAFANNGILTSTNDLFLISSGGVSSGGSSIIRFHTGGYATANEKVRIDHSGRVGIGTISPTAALDVVCSSTNAGAGTYNFHVQNTSAATAGQVDFYFENNRGSFASYGGLLIGGSGNTKTGLFGQANRADKMFFFADGASNLGLFVGTLTAKPVVIGTNNIERIRIDSAGNVGIGTASPSALIHGIKTTEQLRLGYDANNYYSTTVSSAGAVTFDAVGASAGFMFSDYVATASDKAFYLGDPATDGTWRFVRSGNDLVVERRESGNYVLKTTFTA
jgi:hypothetical protein